MIKLQVTGFRVQGLDKTKKELSLIPYHLYPKNGFTLVEILIVITVMVVVSVILVATLVNQNSLFGIENTKVEQGLSLLDASAEIKEAISSGSSIVASITLSGTTYESDSDSLVIATPSFNATGAVIANTYDHIVIQKDSPTASIMRKVVIPNVASSRRAQSLILGTTVETVQFSYLNSQGSTVAPASATKVRFSITLSRTINANDQQTTTTGEVNLRND